MSGHNCVVNGFCGVHHDFKKQDRLHKLLLAWYQVVTMKIIEACFFAHVESIRVTGEGLVSVLKNMSGVQTIRRNLFWD